MNRERPQHGSRLAKVSYASGTGGICQIGYAAPYGITDPQLEMVNYYDDYGFISNDFANAIPTVNIDATQEGHATGSLTGRVVYATDGEALGTVNVYDPKGQVVRYVGKRLGGLVEDVRTAYSFTGAVDTVQVDVNVGYGGSLVATTVYTYDHGMKTKMKLSVSHGRPTQSRETEYEYDAIGRLSGKARQLTGTGRSSCSYTYDVHGWLTSVTNGEFQERLYYADGLDGGCWNGNISTMKWTGAGAGGAYQGYNLEYDGCNRLHDAAYGEGDNLANYRNYFSEHADYDCNGNITRLRRRGLVVNLHGGFGLVDNLYMTYEGNMLTSVCDSASHLPYASATDFDGVPGQEYPLTYNGAGSLVSDAGRGITFVTYDANNNPQQIYFANGNDTKYVYDASGRKLRVIHFTAVPNIMRKFGRKPADLTPSQILYADTTDYLLGGSLTLRNGRIDKLQFEEGYCQAEQYAYDANRDKITFYYYDCDHLGNVRQVITATGTNKGTVVQRMDYYPFGAQLCGGTYDSNFQSHKYNFSIEREKRKLACSSEREKNRPKVNGKEFDRMHGLNTYDYGARLYNPVTAHWDRMDPLCEKYYSVSPYAYCANNPVRYIDQDGKSTKVKLLEDGTYQVIGGDINDKDRNIYVYTQDENDEYTIKGESIGVSATMTSFYNSDDKNPSNRWGGIINPKDNSGILFLNDIMVKNTPNLIEYMYYARNGEKYDFKVTNGTNSVIDGIDPQRGMPLTTNSKGEITYASARDIGNMAAGYIAARNGIPWKTARKAFDFYQGSPEGKTTVNAQLYGYTVLGHNTTAQILLRFLRNNKK